MVSLGKVLAAGLTFAANSQFRDVNAPDLAAKEQYNVVKYLAAAGPYIQNPGSGISTETPDQCTVDQVQIYARHGERFPSLSAGEGYAASVEKLKNYNGTLVGPLNFIPEYTYFVQDEGLYEYETNPINSPGPYTGYDTLTRAGAAFRATYGHLYNENKTLPLFIAASARVQQSALYFAEGFLGESFADSGVIDQVLISENASSGVNSLTPRWACSNLNLSSNAGYVSKFPSTYAENIISRLSDGNPGVNITKSDVANYFSICAYELNVNGYSPFCGLFTNDEFVNYGYAMDLSYYYSSGPGGNYSKLVGSVQLEASLKLLKENTQSIWVTFTHDTDIEIFHSALGLFDTINPLPNDKVEFKDTYHHVDVIPMGGRTITERLNCGNETYVRYIVNDAVIPIPNCASGPGFSCKLSDFEDYVSERLSDIDFFSQCQVPLNVSQELTFYWDYTNTTYESSAPRFTA